MPASTGMYRFVDIVNFSHQLPYAQQNAFLVVFSAVCWTIWKHRKDLCFAEGKPKTPRQINNISNNISLWFTIGQVTCMKAKVADCTALWFPSDMDVLPIATWHPDDVADS